MTNPPKPQTRLTWQQASREAENLCGMILQQVSQLEAAGMRPDQVPLTRYPTREDYAAILGDNPGYTWEAHSLVNKAAQRILSRHKIKARFVDLRAAEYFAWLEQTGQPNNTGSRAQYAASRQNTGV